MNRTTLLHAALTGAIICTSAIATNGQDHLDSLRKTWEDRTLADTVRLAALKDFIWNGTLFQFPDSAFMLSQMMYDTAAHMGLKPQMSAALNMQAIVKAVQGDQNAAIGYYDEALKLSREVGDIPGEATALKNIGLSFSAIDQPFNATQYYAKALALTRSFGDHLEANILINMAVAYTKMDDHAKADDCARQGLAIAEKIDDRKEVLNGVIALADNLSGQGDTEAALPLYERGLALAEQMDDPIRISGCLRGLMRTYGPRGDVAKAIAFGRRALDIAQRTGDPAAIAESYGSLYDAYKRTGHMAEALDMYEHYTEVHDMLLNDDNKAALMRQKAQSDFDTKEAVLRTEMENKDAISAQEIRRQKVVRYGIMAAALLLLAGGGFLFYSDRKRRKERFQKDVAELQTQVLRSQMNSHFIFNALHAINAFVRHNDPEGVSAFLSKFARVIRGILENSRHREVALQDDLEVLRGYIELERKLMDNKFDFTITVDEGIDPEQVMVPPLMLQPLVENAIRHGIADKVGHGHIALQVKRQGDQLVWSVEDDGVGRGAPKSVPGTDVAAELIPVKKTSLATAIIRSRLELLQQRYGGRAGLRYEDLAPGTRVMVDMPVITF